MFKVAAAEAASAVGWRAATCETIAAAARADLSEAAAVAVAIRRFAAARVARNARSAAIEVATEAADGDHLTEVSLSPQFIVRKRLNRFLLI